MRVRVLARSTSLAVSPGRARGVLSADEQGSTPWAASTMMSALRDTLRWIRSGPGPHPEHRERLRGDPPTVPVIAQHPLAGAPGAGDVLSFAVHEFDTLTRFQYGPFA